MHSKNHDVALVSFQICGTEVCQYGPILNRFESCAWAKYNHMTDKIILENLASEVQLARFF